MPTSIGGIRDIILLTDHQNEIQNQIKDILQQPIYTVQPEDEFFVRYRTLQRLTDFIKFRLIFIIGTIDEEPIRTLLENQIDKIENDTFGLFTFSDPWGKDQKVLVFATKSSEFLSRGLARYGPRIRKTLQDYLLAHMTKITYERGYDERQSKTLEQKYNFYLKVPNGFKLVDKYEKDDFIYLVAHNPDRSIFIYSMPIAMELNLRKLISFRDSLTARFYDNDLVYKKYTHAETTLFHDNWSIKLTGVWQNNTLVAGGPFVSYCFNHNNRFYFIDGMLYYPGKKKLDNLNQLNAILNTFRISAKK